MAVGVASPPAASAATCDEPGPGWLACEDFEGGGAGWASWFAQSPFVECLGCADGNENPDRIRLDGDPANAHDGTWSLHMPAAEAAQFQGAALSFRTCEGDPSPGCTLQGYDELYFRTWVRLAEDHQYVHHFLSIGGTQPDEYWGGDGNAGCRPNGYRHAGTTVDFNTDHELFFYTYFPDMNCDAGGYCSGEYAQNICDGCATKDMPCDNGLECCWGNHFSSEPAVVLPRGQWVCLEMMMRINTVGQSDGVMAFWVDDQLGHEQIGMHWRDVPELQLNKAWLQHYIAPGDAEQSNQIWFDDVVVSTQRIGCGAVPPDGGTGSGGETTGAPSGDDGGGDGGGGTDGPSAGTSAGSSPGSGGGGASSTSGTADTDGASTQDDGSGGCGCRSSADTSPWALGLLGLLALRRRRLR